MRDGFASEKKIEARCAVGRSTAANSVLARRILKSCEETSATHEEASARRGGIWARGIKRASLSSARRLVQLYYSPWSERARWALDHHGLAYETVEHVPFLGEIRLRRIVGKKAARATVPVLIDG